MRLATCGLCSRRRKLSHVCFLAVSAGVLKVCLDTKAPKKFSYIYILHLHLIPLHLQVFYIAPCLLYGLCRQWWIMDMLICVISPTWAMQWHSPIVQVNVPDAGEPVLSHAVASTYCISECFRCWWTSLPFLVFLYCNWTVIRLSSTCSTPSWHIFLQDGRFSAAVSKKFGFNEQLWDSLYDVWLDGHVMCCLRL